MGQHDDRREHARVGVTGGNAEITKVSGPRAGRRPSDRARILNWSRGGLLLRLLSPRRRLLVFKQEPALAPQDVIQCTLRLPPQYNEIDVSAEVVRVERCAEDPDQLHVGLSFLSLPPERMEAMARLLEPRPKPVSARVARTSGRHGGRSQRVEKRSERTAARTSQRVEKRTSQRVEQRSGQRAEQRSSQRLEATPSQRLRLHQSETLELRNSERLSRM